MNFDKIKPVVCVSRCLGFDNCCWNGNTINDSFVNLLKDFVEFHTKYILNQIILQPYPKELLLLSDFGKGRNIKR